MDGAYELIGRLHPALVHLPIGILILAVVFVWLDHYGRIKVSREVLRLSLGLGAVTAALAVVTGLVLSSAGEHDNAAVQWHQWMGISTAIAAVVVWRIRASLRRMASILLLVLLTVTGHLGASLTHGSLYLFEPFTGSRLSKVSLLSIGYDSAIAYRDVIAPVLQQHCYTCHGTSKQKAKLRLDEPRFILAGSKNGEVIKAGNPQESELMERLRLPLNDEHHMPPKEKRQPDEAAINIIALWIESGASFDAPLSDAIPSQSWIALVSKVPAAAGDDVPDTDVKPADEDAINDLRSMGVSVSPVAEGSRYLQINFISADRNLRNALDRMSRIADNVVWLKFGNTYLTDSLMIYLRQLSNVTKLGLERTMITDAGLENLKNLRNVTVLNLSGTQVSLEGLTSIANLKNIRSLNLYQTQVRPQLAEQVSKLFPRAEIEFGEYEVPALPTDTVVIK